MGLIFQTTPQQANTAYNHITLENKAYIKILRIEMIKLNINQYVKTEANINCNSVIFYYKLI